MKRNLLLLFCIVMLPRIFLVSLRAQERTGQYFMDTNALAATCRVAVRRMDDPNNSSVEDGKTSVACFQYVEGVLDAFEATKSSGLIGKANRLCIPSDVLSGQAVRVLMKYTDDHPEILNTAAATSVWSAMHAVFPCK